MKKLKSIVLYLFFICSCADTTNNKNIIGQWQGVNWSINAGTSQRNAAATEFSFDDKGNYVFTYDGTVQKGTYAVENSMLFTKAEGEQEIMVKIERLSQDTLVFNMNRGGQKETLVLRRKQ